MVAVHTKINFEELVGNASDASRWYLTNLEKAALAGLIEDVVETVVEVGTVNGWFVAQSDEANAGDWADLTLRLTENLIREGQMLPRLLAASMTEHFVCGDRSIGEADPPEDGILGQPTAEYMRKVGQVARLRLSPEFAEAFYPFSGKPGPWTRSLMEAHEGVKFVPSDEPV